MTKTAFTGPGLSEEQWLRLKDLATSLSPEQSNWVGGYFTGYADAARSSGAGASVAAPLPAAAAAAAVAQRSLTILFGSETGTGMELAERAGTLAAELGLAAKVIDMADYKPGALKDEQDLVLVCSTHGEGEPPQPALGFFEFLAGRKAPALNGTRFAVLALGDSTYEFYCGAGKQLDQRLEELGAERIAPCIACDVDQIKDGRDWIATVLAQLAASMADAAPEPVAATAGAATASAAFDEAHPFAAPLLDNIVLTGRGSSKETRHLEIGLDGSGLSYEPGDALGIVAHNDARLVEAVLGSLQASAEAPLQRDGQTVRLGDALTEHFEIATATPRFLTHWAELSGAETLQALAAGPAAERLAFLNAHHIIDIMDRFPVPGVAPEVFVAGLRALQPRLYSIASSQAAQDGDAHLTVSTVRYQLHGSGRQGVVSGMLAGLGDAEATLPVYIKANPQFRLPADDVPIIMIGAGTGVAPYRAFIQEREVRGASGRSWLVFGERNFRSDFLYQTDWQGHLKNGSLTRMDVAFSRDGAERTYVQQRLREAGRDLHAWLQEGAQLYVCGDAARMAPDVQAAVTGIVAEHGALTPDAAESYVRELQSSGRYQRDVY